MAITNQFVSIPFREVVGGETFNGNMHSGTSTSAADYIELRWIEYTTGTTASGVTRKDILIALKVFERWIKEGGLIGDGTNLPLS
jgi:hypothetical protein